MPPRTPTPRGLVDKIRRIGFFLTQALGLSSSASGLSHLDSGSGDLEGQVLGPGLGPPPDHVGRFLILDELGRGGMGVVYRARDPDLSREVALKVLKGLSDQRRLDRMKREGQITASLKHPGIVGIHEAGYADGLPYLAYELVVGARTFGDVVEGLDRTSQIELLIETARAVGHAHSHGVVHRDLKPDNVLIDADGHARVADFGLAWAQGVERLTQTGIALGTPYFMSPEQYRSDRERIGPTSDVWSLGVMLYKVLTGTYPFQATTLAGMGREITKASPPRPSELDPTITPAMEAVCLKALARRTHDRYPDAEVLADAMDVALVGGDVEPVRPQGMHPLWLVLGFGVVVALGVGAFALLSRSASRPPEVTEAPTAPDPETPGDPQRAPGPPSLPEGVVAGPTPTTWVNERDDSVLVWVPPARFEMGRDEVKVNLLNSPSPAHQVELTQGFLMGKHEVSWAQFRQFCQATGQLPPRPLPGETDDHPVHSVTWLDAQAYCRWAGGRLPTEAEWELAARGTGRFDYPWGNDPPTAAGKLANLVHGPKQALQVMTLSAGHSPFGCLNMVGNVSEWVQDWFASYPKDKKPRRDPAGYAPSLDVGTQTRSLERACRGASYKHEPAMARATERFKVVPFGFKTDLGFRLCRPLVLNPRALPPLSWTVEVFQSRANPYRDYKRWRTVRRPVRFEVPRLRLHYGKGSPSALPNVPAEVQAAQLPEDGFGTIAWTEVDLPAGRWAVGCIANDGIKLFVDGKLVRDLWRLQHATVVFHEIPERTARRVKLRVEHFEAGSEALLSVDLFPIR